jgi:hypothetical protein
MKIAAIIILLIVGISTAYANFMLLHVGPGGFGGAAPPGSCDGTIDLSTGCVQPMLR